MEINYNSIFSPIYYNKPSSVTCDRCCDRAEAEGVGEFPNESLSAIPSEKYWVKIKNILVFQMKLSKITCVALNLADENDRVVHVLARKAKGGRLFDVRLDGRVH
jgi:hypothetical protein